MVRYHVNSETGKVGKCSAVSGKCPFGSSDEHYTSKEAAQKAYENFMDKESLNSVKVSRPQRRVKVSWSDLTEGQREVVARQDTALRDEYFQDRELDARLTHEVVWPVVKEWDDFMMGGVLPDGSDPLDSFYENEGDIGSKFYTNSYDAKVRWLKRVAKYDYPLLEEL